MEEFGCKNKHFRLISKQTDSQCFKKLHSEDFRIHLMRNFKLVFFNDKKCQI
ncbi:hypothetical protein FEDK69T_06710 [Flavobacterium enshiense DK69]|nr:hypothetical protein FEDK69T_06710 [Flavobacterium enshiense DK69]